MKPILALTAALLVLAGCQSRKDKTETTASQPAATTPLPADTTTAGATTGGRLVDIGGDRHLYMRSRSAGTPAVVIEMAIGDDERSWTPVIDAISSDTRVITYARAGYGDSDPGPMPRSADRIARDLDAMLASAGVRPPVVLVGHSSGAVTALVYAAEHHHRLAGLVLVDPIPAEMLKGERFPQLVSMSEAKTAGFRRDADAARARGDAREAAWCDAMASEHEELFRSGWALLGSVPGLGDLPLVVVGADRPNPAYGEDAAAIQAAWSQSNRDLARMSVNGHFIVATGSSHDIQRDTPEVVVSAIRECLDMATRMGEPVYYQGDK